MPMITVEDLHVNLGESHVLQGVSFDVPEGGVTALLGRNGVGKTTTLRAMMGLVPRRGSVKLAGDELTRRQTHAIVRRGVGYVPEDRDVFSGLTVEENLRLGLAGRGSREGLDDDLAWIYDLFPIVHEFRKRNAGALSGGQQQQLAIARALVARPEVLLLDEPSLGLAPTIVDAVFAALAAIRERGVTALLVEQRAQRTVAFADRTYLIANGELRLTLTPDQADDTSTMVAAYLS